MQDCFSPIVRVSKLSCSYPKSVRRGKPGLNTGGNAKRLFMLVFKIGCIACCTALDEGVLNCKE